MINRPFFLYFNVLFIMFFLLGIPRLVKLCRNAEARNNSDAVLVACLVRSFSILLLIC